MKTAIFFCYNNTYSNVKNSDRASPKENLNFFINHGITNTENIHYYILCNHCKLDIKMPNYKNIFIYENIKSPIGHAFGAWGIILKKININDYDYFFFLKDTARGPFINNSLKEFIPHWTDIFTKKINDKTKLICPYIYPIPKRKNYCNKPNATISNIYKKFNTFLFGAMSFMFVTDKIGINIIISNNLFTDITMPGHEVENNITGCILENNYNIECLTNNLKNINFLELYNSNIKENYPDFEDFNELFKCLPFHHNDKTLEEDIHYKTLYKLSNDRLCFNPYENIFICTKHQKEKFREKYYELFTIIENNNLHKD